MIKVEIGHGLPGSGKTTYLKGIRDKNTNRFGCNYLEYIDCDKLLKDAQSNSWSNLSTEDKFKRNLEEKLQYCNYRVKNRNYDFYVLIDILSTTNDDLIKLINIIKECLTNFNVLVHWWQEDRESCIWNDENRRDENCLISIKSLPFEKPNVELIEKQTGIKIKTNMHCVERKSKAMHFAHKHFLCDDSGILQSNSWSLGGTHGDCWGGVHPSSPEEPDEFEAFDNMIEKLAPNVTFLQYKKLRRACVELKTWRESDYYGGHEDYSCYECNIEKLIDMMLEMGLIEE